MSNIITNFVYPPIPTRQYDWTAYRDGTEESGPYGFGETKEAAVQDLLNQEAENDTDDLMHAYETDRENEAIGREDN